MGLSVLGAEEPWIEIDEHLGEELREKDRLFSAHRSQVYVEQSRSLPAQREIRDVLAEHLCAVHPDLYRRRDDGLEVAPLGATLPFETPERAPLECASRWVQEDLCVMEYWDGAWRLSAGSVCFPTRWNLPSKLGLPLTDIHAPVPGYAETLARSADRFFDAMTPGRAVWRVNWSLSDRPDLFQPLRYGAPRPPAAVTAQNAGDTVWIRIERQTLRRFERSDAILFTIRVHRRRLRSLRHAPDAAAGLVGALRSMDAELHGYKSLPPLHDAVIAFLEHEAL